MQWKFNKKEYSRGCMEVRNFSFERENLETLNAEIDNW